MSYFDDASLVMIPSGYKTSKVYSVKPTDGTGDLAFTRSNDTATRVGPDGLIEKVRTNLFLYSEQFNNAAAWSTQGSPTISANASVAPDGTTTADLLYPSVNGSVVAAIQSITSASSVEYTQSVYVKASGKNFVGLYTFNGTTGTAMWVNLTTGAITNGVGANVSNRFATNVGNGWWRIGFTDIGNGTTTYMHVYPTDAASSNSVTASGTNGILLWGAQLETGVATPYIATTTAAVSVGPLANVPRLDYLGSSCPRLLLEPQRTNLAFYSEQFNDAYWTKTAGTTITANTTISPDGYTNADTIAFAGSGDSINLFLTTGLSVVSGTTYTMSLFTKSTTQVVFFGGATGGSGTNVYNGSVDYGNGWYRQSVTRTWSASGTVSVQLVITLGAVGSTIAYGFQAEVGAYATSYIPTLGASVTRGADACSKTGISSLIGQTEGVIFFDVTLDSRASSTWFTVAPNLASGNVYIGIQIGSTNLQAEVFDAASPQAVISFTNSSTGRFKAALAYKANDFVFYVNGTLVGTDTSGTVPACSALGLYNYAQTASVKYNQALLFPTRLTNAQLAELTTI